jgi:hypothetical protein
LFLRNEENASERTVRIFFRRSIALCSIHFSDRCRANSYRDIYSIALIPGQSTPGPWLHVEENSACCTTSESKGDKEECRQERPAHKMFHSMCASAVWRATSLSLVNSLHFMFDE